VTDELLGAIGRSVPGLDGETMLAAVDSEAVSARLASDGAAAAAANVTGTPAFELGPTGGELTRLEVASLGPEEFRAAIDELLGR
jgi:predicted DsbA family dithiol-disulfide isomerase